MILGSTIAVILGGIGLYFVDRGQQQQTQWVPPVPNQTPRRKRLRKEEEEEVVQIEKQTKKRRKVDPLPDDNLPGEDQLASVIGLESVKEYVRDLRSQLKINEWDSERGVTTPEPIGNFVFQGNPGTGKTTIARILGNLLQEFGCLKEGNFIEASRSTLVGQFQGNTAIKTREVCESALNGVLFIDEAYLLCNGDRDDFGNECIGELVSFMENHRSELVVIMAGYPDDMRRLLRSNQGLRSRFTNFVDFPDYSVAEMVQIAARFLEDRKLKMTRASERALTELIESSSRERRSSNARFVRNLVKAMLTRRARHLDEKYSSGKRPSKQVLGSVLPEYWPPAPDAPTTEEPS